MDKSKLIIEVRNAATIRELKKVAVILGVKVLPKIKYDYLKSVLLEELYKDYSE